MDNLNKRGIPDRARLNRHQHSELRDAAKRWSVGVAIIEQVMDESGSTDREEIEKLAKAAWAKQMAYWLSLLE